MRECLEWGFKMTVFLDSFKHITSMHGAENVAKIVSYINEVMCKKKLRQTSEAVRKSSVFWKILPF